MNKLITDVHGYRQLQNSLEMEVRCRMIEEDRVHGERERERERERESGKKERATE